MNPRRQQRLGAALAVILLVGGAIGALLYAMQENVDLFYTPTQLVEGLGEDKTKPVVGQRLRIGGMVVKGSVKRDANSLKVSFDLQDTGPIVTVIYDGILPDLFREGQGIVAQGVLVNATTIEATEVLAKHDENYMPPEVAEAMKGIKHVPPRLQQNGADGSSGYGSGGYGSGHSNAAGVTYSDDKTRDDGDDGVDGKAQSSGAESAAKPAAVHPEPKTTSSGSTPSTVHGSATDSTATDSTATDSPDTNAKKDMP